MTNSIAINQYSEQVEWALADREEHSGFQSAQKLSQAIKNAESLIMECPGMGGDYRDGRILTWDVLKTYTIYYQSNEDKDVEFISFLFKKW